MPKQKIVNGVRVERELYKPGQDLYVIFGSSSERPDISYLLLKKRGARHPCEMRPYTNRKSALNAFRRILDNKLPPIPDIFEDTQRSKVYDWEFNHVDPSMPEITFAQAKRIIKKVCNDHGLERLPLLEWLEEGEKSKLLAQWGVEEDEEDLLYSFYRYLEDDNDLIILRHHDLRVTLHELAHLLISRATGEAFHYEVDHAPAFVWTAIDLYSRYGGLSLPYLVTTAQQAGILGDLNVSQHFEKKKSSSPSPFGFLPVNTPHSGPP